jgi:hypothetical protein
VGFHVKDVNSCTSVSAIFCPHPFKEIKPPLKKCQSGINPTAMKRMKTAVTEITGHMTIKSVQLWFVGLTL